MSVPFIGRRDELDVIHALISRARRESAPVAGLISGAPGCGKSRLLHEALAGVDPQRRVAVTGFEPIQPVPLAAVGDLIRRLEAVPDHGQRLHELAFGSPELGGPGSLQVFEAAHRALTAFGPLVLAIDDLQWVDAQSLALVYYLVTAAESSRRPLAVIAASRPSPVAATFARGIAGLLSDDRHSSVDLRGLPLEQGVAFARAIDDQLDQATAESLWRRADGSPFWLEALTRGRISANAADLLLDRVQTLSPDGGRLLGALAIAARPVEHDELGAFTEWASDRFEHAARELVGRGLAIDEAGLVRLTHDLIREAATNAMPHATRRSLHARMAHQIERTAGDDLRQFAEALDHRVAAGLPTHEIAMRIIRSPQHRLLGAEDLRRLSLLADQLPVGSAEQREIDAGIASVAVELGERERAIRHWSRLSATTDDPHLRQRAHLEAARAGFEGGHPSDVYRHLAAARSIPLDPVMAIELDAIEAHVRLEDESDVVGGAAAAARAVAGGRELISAFGGADGLSPVARAAVVEAFLVAAGAAKQQDRPDELLEFSAAALAIADSLSEEKRLPALLGYAFALSILGRLAEAEERYREAWEASQRLLLPRSMVEAALFLALVLRDRGRLMEARSLVGEADALQARIRPWLWGDMSQTVRHLIDLSLGKPGAIAGVRASMTGMTDHFRIEIHEILAVWLAREAPTRNATAVERELDAATAASIAIGCSTCARDLQAISAEALARIGRVRDAELALGNFETGYDGPMHPTRRLLVARAKASIAIANQSSEAVDAIGELAVAAGAADKPLEVIWARLDLGDVLRRRGDRTQAIEAYTDAASLAHSLGAAGIERIASRALRDLGVRAWRRGTSSRGGGALAALTDRELEIAGLVAAGSSNQEVAEALALSPKTIERHVTNILAKVGARNRTGLAALVHMGSVRDSPGA